MVQREHLQQAQVGEQLSLFDVSEYTLPEPKMDYDPASWLQRPDVVYHASESHPMSGEAQETGHATNFGIGFHTGSAAAAMQRANVTSTSQISSDDYHRYSQRPYIHPVRMEGQSALRDEPNKSKEPRILPGEKYSDESYQSNRRYHDALLSHPLVFADEQANMDRGTEIVKSGRNVPYVNAAESAGSISFRSPRENLSTWAEDVAADPGASRHHKLLAEQFDLTIPVRENWGQVLRAPRTGWVANASGTDAIHMGKAVNARNLPESLSGEVTEQPTLDIPWTKRGNVVTDWGGPMGEEKLSGSSKLPILTPRMKKKG